MRRVLFVVLDGVGVGALPDADEYGDADACTLGHVVDLVRPALPHLADMGIGNLLPLRGVPATQYPSAFACRVAECSAGKDSTTGHWEHMGLVLEWPFPTYPMGFPPEIVTEFERRIGRGTLGNVAASGTEIIDRLGADHVRTGFPILYTSADSVFQLAAHVDIISVPNLYEMCETARVLLLGRHGVGRVIARPFSGTEGAFYRTRERRDYSLPPPGRTYVDELAARGVPVVGIGKVGDLFTGRGFTETRRTGSNEEGVEAALEALSGLEHGLVLANLNDFDGRFGHRNDVEGFARALVRFDGAIPRLRRAIGAGDLLIITADHGCDPTTVSFDHSREYVPLLVWPRSALAGTGSRWGEVAPKRGSGRRLPRRAEQRWMSDSGATAFLHLVGEEPPLAGRALQRCVERGSGRDAGAFGSGVTRGGPVTHTVSRPAYAPAATVRGAAFLRARMGEVPSAAVILGSGLGGVAQALRSELLLEYSDVPGWPVGNVEGHEESLRIAEFDGRTVLLLLGRVHGYEGVGRPDEEFAVRLLGQLGVRRIIVTNASGALEDGLVGKIAWVEQVLDVKQCATTGRPALLAGASPLCARALLEPLSSLRVPGVTYAAVPGPQYETAAEAELLRRLGCDVVGMSAVAEVAAARAGGLEYATLTLVTNRAGVMAADGSGGHSRVIEAAAGAVERIAALLRWLCTV